ncbi:hypothetical protein EJ03DRAFT_354421, partial [Teratosphaeria nubilosa]
AGDAIKVSPAPESTPPPTACSPVTANDPDALDEAPAAVNGPVNPFEPSAITARELDEAFGTSDTCLQSAHVPGHVTLRGPKRPKSRVQMRRETQAEARKRCVAEEKARRAAEEAARRREAAEQAAREEAARRMRQAEEEEKARQRREAEAEAHRLREAREQALREEAARKARELEEARWLRESAEQAAREEQEARRRRELDDEARRLREAQEQAAREEAARESRDLEEARKQREAAEQAARIEELRRQRELAEEAARNAALQKQREDEERLAREQQAALEKEKSRREEAEDGEEMDGQATGAALGVGIAPETEMGDDEEDDARAQALKEEEEEKKARATDVEMSDGQMPEVGAFGPIPQSAGPPAATSPAPPRRKAIPKPFSARSWFHGQSVASFLSAGTPSGIIGPQNTTTRPIFTPATTTTTTNDTEHNPVRDRVAAPDSGRLKRQDTPPQGADTEEDSETTEQPATKRVNFVAPTSGEEAELLHRPAFRDRGVPVTWVPQGNSNLAFKTTAISQQIESWYQDIYEWFHSLPKRSQRPSAAELQEYSKVDTELRMKMIDRTPDIDTIHAFYSDLTHVDLFASPDAPAAIFDNAVRRLNQLVPPKGPLLSKLFHQPTAALEDAALERKRQIAAEEIKTVCRKITEVHKSIEKFLLLVAKVNKGNRSLQCMQPAYSRAWKAKDEEWRERQGVVFSAWKANGDVWARLGDGERMEG